MINTASFALFFLLFTKYSGAIFITSGDYEDKALNNTFFNPQYYDVMLTDLDYAKISDISLVDLRFEHNSLTSSRPTFPISGIVAVAPSYVGPQLFIYVIVLFLLLESITQITRTLLFMDILLEFSVQLDTLEK
eukprot:gene26566-35234_t